MTEEENPTETLPTVTGRVPGLGNNITIIPLAYNMNPESFFTKYPGAYQLNGNGRRLTEQETGGLNYCGGILISKHSSEKLFRNVEEVYLKKIGKG